MDGRLRSRILLRYAKQHHLRLSRRARLMIAIGDDAGAWVAVLLIAIVALLGFLNYAVGR